MADPLLTVEIDATALMAALDQLGPAAHAHIKTAAKETAERVAAEARRRVRKRTGQTAQGINVREDFAGTGYIVASDREPYPNIPIWLEHGTTHAKAYPYFHNAVSLEQGPHLRRVERAIQDAIDAQGLG